MAAVRRDGWHHRPRASTMFAILIWWVLYVQTHLMIARPLAKWLVLSIQKSSGYVCWGNHNCVWFVSMTLCYAFKIEWVIFLFTFELGVHFVLSFIDWRDKSASSFLYSELIPLSQVKLLTSLSIHHFTLPGVTSVCPWQRFPSSKPVVICFQGNTCLLYLSWTWL